MNTCEACGASYAVNPNIAGHYMPSRWCPSCRPAAQKREARRVAREWYWAHREQAAAYQREHGRATGYAAQRAWNSTTCTRCGAIHLTSLKKPDRTSYLCGKCKAEARMVAWTCRVCDGTFRDPRAYIFCDDCYGLFTRIGAKVGLSRERIRQLANQHKARYGVTLKVGAEMVLRQRQAVAS